MTMVATKFLLRIGSAWQNRNRVLKLAPLHHLGAKHVMPETIVKGIPYPSSEAAGIDDWSERVYRALSAWPLAQTGYWSRWEPGYLLLVIDHVDGKAVEPIQLYTADEEVTVECSLWHDHLCGDGPGEDTPEEIAEQAKVLIHDWLDGKFRAAVFTDANGKWCGTSVTRHGDLDAQLAEIAQHVRHLAPHSVELRSADKKDWKTIAVNPDWLHPPKLSPDRLP